VDSESKINKHRQMEAKLYQGNIGGSLPESGQELAGMKREQKVEALKQEQRAGVMKQKY
jgi:hypothetical protein